MSLPADERPFDHTPITTAELPATPTRDRNISALAWVDAPRALLELGDDLGIDAASTAYKRQIGSWFLWRAGPTRGPARYLALDRQDLQRSFTFDVHPDQPNHGVGPGGTEHTRFRTWKEDLLDRSVDP